MDSRKLLLAALTCLPLTAWTAAPNVRVEYAAPDQFTDVGDSRPTSERARDAYLGMLRAYIVERAGRLLPEGQALEITVTDVDMAGGFEPWHRQAREVRIIRDIYPPRIDLTFRLTAADGSVVKAGDRQLRDAGFLITSDRFASDVLRHEKALIDRWLSSELKRPGA